MRYHECTPLSLPLSPLPPPLSLTSPSPPLPCFRNADNKQKQTIDFVRERLKGRQGAYPLSSVCGELCDACCAETSDGDGTGLDNVTAVIVELNTAGASELTGGRGGVPATGAALEGEGSGEMDTSDDGKRKQEGGEEGQGGARGRAGKQMRAEKPEVGGVQVESGVGPLA